MFVLFSTSLFAYTAETGWKGYAVYRNGVVTFLFYSEGLNDHAAIMDEKNKNDYLPIIHARGNNYSVMWDDWETFMYDNNTNSSNKFKGIYKPKNVTINSVIANRLSSKARELIGIQYTFMNQLETTNNVSGSWIDPLEISRIRCDGVIEYIYEWYGYRVGGGDGKWDITYNNSQNYNEHKGFNITPRSQRLQYLENVSGLEP